MYINVFNIDIRCVVLPKCDRHILYKTDVDQVSPMSDVSDIHCYLTKLPGSNFSLINRLVWSSTLSLIHY